MPVSMPSDLTSTKAVLSLDLTAKCTKNKFDSYKQICRIFAVKPEGTRHNPESNPKKLSEELKSQWQRKGNVRLGTSRS